MTCRFLLINPNTSSWVTDALAQQIHRVVGTSRALELDKATATLGASYIATEAAYVIAGHALLDCYAAHVDGHDAVVVGCFGDPGMEALREISGMPVIGMADAAMAEAARQGRFAIVTGGSAWRPMLLRLAGQLGYRDQLADVLAVAQSAADLARDREQALRVLEQSCRQANTAGATTVVLGGAAFAGYGDELAERTGMAIIDSVSATARAMVTLADTLPAKPTSDPASRRPSGATYSGISAPLAALLQ